MKGADRQRYGSSPTSKRAAAGGASRDPAPEGFVAATVRPAEAFFSKELGEFILPYDAVRTSSDPEATLLAFLQSTYDAAANLAAWDRAALECELGAAGRVRPV